MKLDERVLSRADFCINLRRWFHQHPELSLQEFNTALKIEEELDKLGIEHERIGDTGVYAKIQGKLGKGKVLAIRADIDALKIQDLKTECAYRSLNEGVLHACGHDGHTASLLTTAAVLKERENDFAGEVRLLFEQAEECGQGARLFVKAGCLNGVDRVIGYHGSSSLDVGTVSCTPGANNASCDYFKITVRGKSAHVSKPDQAIDALYIASLIVVSLQSIVSRKVSPLDTVVVGIGVLNSGTTYNIVANEAVLEGTTRSFSEETRQKVNGLVQSISEEIAHAHGADIEVHFESYANPLINDLQVSNEAAECARWVVGEDHVIQNQEKRLDADDFADYLKEVPGCYMFVGTRNQIDSHTASAHHHGLFDIDEKSMLIASSCIIKYAEKFFGMKD